MILWEYEAGRARQYDVFEKVEGGLKVAREFMLDSKYDTNTGRTRPLREAGVKHTQGGVSGSCPTTVSSHSTSPMIVGRENL